MGSHAFSDMSFPAFQKAEGYEGLGAGPGAEGALTPVYR